MTPAQISKMITSAAGSFAHARKCKKSECDSCVENIKFFATLPLPTLALILQDEPAISRRAKMVDVAAWNTLSLLEGKDLSQAASFSRSLRGQITFAALCDRVRRGEEIHFTHSTAHPKWERA